MKINRRTFMQSAAATGLLMLTGQSRAHDFEHTAVLLNGPSSGWGIGTGKNGWHIGNGPGDGGWHIGKSPEPKKIYLPAVMRG